MLPLVAPACATELLKQQAADEVADGLLHDAYEASVHVLVLVWRVVLGSELFRTLPDSCLEAIRCRIGPNTRLT